MSETHRPTVSICIPTYNMAQYLDQAIQSVLSQDFRDLELVVVDDASTDTTPGLCRKIGDPRFRYVRPTERLGQAGNFNRCVQEAIGEFVTLLHADDYFLPGFIEDRVTRLRGNPSTSFAFGGVQVVDACGQLLSISARWQIDRILEGSELLAPLLDACIVCPSSLMFRLDAARRAGPYRQDLTWGHDWEWSLRLGETGSASYTAAPLVAYRVHAGSGTTEILAAAKNGPQERRILEEALARLSRVDSRLAILRRPSLRSLSRRHMYYAHEALLASRMEAARHNLRFAAGADTTMLLRPAFWALLLGSVGLPRVYSVFQRLRSKGN